MINKLNKQLIRRQLLNNRKILSKRAITEQSHRIAESLINSNMYRQSKNIMLYMATKSEVQTQEIIHSAQKEDKKIFIPLIIRESNEIMPSLIQDFKTELTPGALGIMQPKEEYYRVVQPDILDLVIVPGVAFTRQGQRLGRGGGYYDRFLSRLGQHTVSVGLAFEMQIVEQIPTNEKDMPVDYIITEEGIIQIKQY